MDNKLATLINLVKHMPEKCPDQAIETVEKMKGEAEKAGEQKPRTVRIALALREEPCG
jgi:hypothetical protein